MAGSAGDDGEMFEATVCLSHVNDLPDARQPGKVVYPLDEVWLLALLAVLAGAETFTDSARFGEQKLALLRRFRPFRDGTPPHDRIGDISATLDADHFQRRFVAWVVLALKGHQGSLRQDVELFATEQQATGFADTKVSQDKTVDGDHGRVETRITTVVHDVEWLRQRHNRPGLKAVVMVESSREISGKTERGTRFHTTSLVMVAAPLGPAVRSHWATENSLHRVMDMMFRDDEGRVRTDHAPANFTTIKHMAHNLPRTATSKEPPTPAAQSGRLG